MTAHHRSRLRQIARVVFAVFLVLVAILLIRYARSVDWSQVIAAIDGYRLPTLLAGQQSSRQGPVAQWSRGTWAARTHWPSGESWRTR